MFRKLLQKLKRVLRSESRQLPNSSTDLDAAATSKPHSPIPSSPSPSFTQAAPFSTATTLTSTLTFTLTPKFTSPAAAVMPSKTKHKRKRSSQGGRDTTRYLTSGSGDNVRVASIEKAFDDLINPSRGDTRDVLSTETTLEYIQDFLGANVENAEMFVVMELIQAPAMGEMNRQGFVDGWKATDLTTFTKATQKKYVHDLVAKLSTDYLYFRKVYRHAFVAGKEASQKSLAQDYAKIYWSILFAPPGRPWKTQNRDWATLWAQFIDEKYSHSVSKDLWNMTLEFANKTLDDEALTFYSAEDSWPGVIDDFVDWYRQKYPKAEEDQDVNMED